MFVEGGKDLKIIVLQSDLNTLGEYQGSFECGHRANQELCKHLNI